RLTEDSRSSDIAEAGAPRVDTAGDGRLVHELFSAPPALALWRAPTDNDRISGLADRWAAWGVADLIGTLEGIERTEASTTVRSETRTGSGITIKHQQRLTGLSDGGILVDELVGIPDELDDLARVGTVLEVVPGLERLEWSGRGPHETYPDRCRGGAIGRWLSTVSEQYVPYIRPQENGGHADCRWLELRDASGRGLRITFDRPGQTSGRKGGGEGR